MSMNGISQNKALCEAEQREIYKCFLFHFASYVQHTLYTVLQDTSFSFPTTNNFSKSVYSEITGQSAWRVLFRPPSLVIEGHQNLTHFNSGLLISRTFLTHASSCTLLCLYLASHTHKKCVEEHTV